MERRLNWMCALAIALVTSFGAPPVASAVAGPANNIVISEVQTATVANAAQEFVELYNPTSTPVSLTGWTVSYKAATSGDSSWTKRATLAGSLPAHGFYLIAPKSYLTNADAEWSATLAASGGNIRLADASGTVIDQLGYGVTAISAETMPAAAPPAGQSLERLPGRLDEQGGNGVDTGDNSADFIVRTVPQPQSLASPAEFATAADPEEVTVEPVPDPVNDSDTSPVPTTYDLINITELLVNPMSPQTDAQNEYIELYNPGDNPVNLKGYTLRAGSNFHEYYVLPDTVLAAGEYTVLFSSQTKLALPNGGGAVALLDPVGAVLDQTPAYGKAPDGQAWAAFDSGWAWTLQLTPGRSNVLATLTPVTSSGSVKAPKLAKATVKKAVAPKAKAKKAAPAASAHKPRKKAVPKPVAHSALAAVKANLIPAGWLIAVLASLTIGYALYEFREDMYRYYRRLRGDAGARSPDRSKPEGRRRD